MRKQTVLALVSLGSNRGDSRQIIAAAVDRLRALAQEPLLKSSLWRSTPVDCPAGSPLFVNAAVALVPAPQETPETLLKKFQDLEFAFGRERKKVINEPRLLDLDLISFGTETRNHPELTLPHPRAHQRRFVLLPLSEIVPDLILPNQTRTIRQLCAGLISDEKLWLVQ